MKQVIRTSLFATTLMAAALFGPSAVHAFPHVHPGTNGRLVIQSTRLQAGRQNLYLLNADGTNVQRLTNTTARDNYAQFSPNGRRLAYLRSATLAGGGLQISLWVINVDGTGARRLAILGSSSLDERSFA